MATSNMYRKFCEVWTRGFWVMWVDRQTHRHREADRNTLHCSWGKSKNYYTAEWNDLSSTATQSDTGGV